MKGLKLNIFKEQIPFLEIGDNHRILTDGEIERANAESKRVRGLITFEDGSKCKGTCQIILGERVFRVGNEVVNEVSFRQDEYFAPMDS